MILVVFLYFVAVFIVACVFAALREWACRADWRRIGGNAVLLAIVLGAAGLGQAIKYLVGA